MVGTTNVTYLVSTDLSSEIKNQTSVVHPKGN